MAGEHSETKAAVWRVRAISRCCDRREDGDRLPRSCDRSDVRARRNPSKEESVEVNRNTAAIRAGGFAGISAVMVGALACAAAICVRCGRIRRSPDRSSGEAGTRSRICRLRSRTAMTRRCSPLRRRQQRAAGGAKITVFDANNDPKAQFAQLQTAATSKQYNAIIIQPIFGTGLISEVKAAIKNKHQGRQHGPGTRREPLERPSRRFRASPATSSSCRRTDRHESSASCVVRRAKAKNLNPCNVGYLYDIKASALDVAIRSGFDKAVEGHSTSRSSPRARASSLREGSRGRADDDARRTRHQHDRRLRPGHRGRGPGRRPSKVTLVGYGGSAAGLKGIADGKLVRHGDAAAGDRGPARSPVRDQGGEDRQGLRRYRPGGRSAERGVVTKANVAKFKGEWPG